ncbi:hypothetical protein RO3G_00389 [Rhizopus delemar RA 99-880]|uniref:Uncharacterized protein n=1 Tax=Rhizopus delemar (strain RA 99-880 / ATCC MYA-4621 / FGSC 9543 / NRRL 43880) TaxID=246409 RepID=I1BHK5_RHIO9|nr:hypothetical protein RO3G_00389 [Rhizopus delemar RA 99-880]|eukprot:EIE75685.1 hypothetical protein RO3G_00389 [Rhizopus delemar RA 99-880]
MADFYKTGDHVAKRIDLVYKGLRSIAKLIPQTRDENSFVGIYATNSYSCHMYGLVTVPISAYASITHLFNVLQKTSLKVLVIDSSLLPNVLNAIGNDSNLKHIIVIGDVSNLYKKEAQVVGIELVSFAELEEYGANKKYEDILVVNQESKRGVVLTHKNLLSNIYSILGYVLIAAISFLGGSVVLGPEIDYSNNVDVAFFLSDIAQNKPTIFASGSWFLEQVKHLISSRYGKSFLFKRGYDVKREYLEEGRLINDCKYDMLVFRSIRQTLFGGNLHLIYIDNAASMFYDYSTIPEARGAPLPSNEIKLIDLKERSFTAEDKPNPRGEIWVRGNNVFDCYYKDEQTNSNVFDSNNWFMTGYIGEFLPNGTLKVLGKK